MLVFNNPLSLLTLLLILVFFIFRKLKIFKKIAFPLTTGDWEGRYFTWKRTSLNVGKHISVVLCCLGVFFLIIALADPQISYRKKVYTSQGAEIMFVVDTSISMSALDIGDLSRLQSAQTAIELLAKSIDGTALGLVIMASEAATIVPPSLDHELFLKRLKEIQIGQLGDGTALGVGITTAIYHLSASSAPSKCLVLLTDGENNAGEIHPETAAELAKSQKIPLYIVGIGTTGTVPVDYIDIETGKHYSGYLESNFDSTYLSDLATTGNGKYFSVENLQDLSKVLQTIAKNESVSQSFVFIPEEKPLYKECLMIAGILFILVYIIRRLYMKEIL